MDRQGFIGGSDAKRLIDGEWFELWQEKTGRAKPEDLTHRFEVQLGLHTEKFHLDWLNKYHGFDIVRFPVQSNGQYDWMKASLDGWSYERDTFVEAKHSSGRANRDMMLDWYQPQVAHYCNVVNRDHGWLSYIAGNSAPDFFKLTPSREYREALVELEKAFWWHVENDTPPDRLAVREAEAAVDTLIATAKDARLDDMRVIDMQGNNEWANHAVGYMVNKAPAAAFEEAKKGLKALVEADVRVASGHGLIVKRSKSGSLLIQETNT